MPVPDILLTKLDSVQNSIQQLNAPDSLVASSLADINANLSAISTRLTAQAQHQFLGVSWDILLPASVSILIFVLGYLVNLWMSCHKEKKARSLVRNTIITWADINLPHLYEYAGAIEKLAQGIKKTPYLSTVPCTPQHISFDVLTQFPADRLMDALYFGLSGSADKILKIKMFNQYMSCVSLFEKKQISILDKYNEYYSLVHDIRNEWNIKWRVYSLNIRQNNMRLISAPDSPEKRYYQTLGMLITSHFKDEVNFAENDKIIEASKDYINTESESVVSTDIIKTNEVFNDLLLTTKRVRNLETYSVAFSFLAKSIAECTQLFSMTIEFYKRTHHSRNALEQM